MDEWNGMAARDRAMLLFVVTCPSFLLKQQQQVEKRRKKKSWIFFFFLSMTKESITQSLLYYKCWSAKWRGNMIIVSSAYTVGDVCAAGDALMSSIHSIIESSNYKFKLFSHLTPRCASLSRPERTWAERATVDAIYGYARVCLPFDWRPPPQNSHPMCVCVCSHAQSVFFIF